MAKWKTNNIPEQKERVAIVTGSSSGIGFETARVLAQKGARVIIAVRNEQKGKAAAEKIIGEQADANVEVMILDLADLAAVKTFADEFRSKYSNLDLLINNAGVMVPPYTKTKDGFELQMGTNHLGHFALTGHLLELLKNTPGSRIVNVSSMAHKGGNINFSDLAWEKRRYIPWRAYCDSKIANLYFTRKLAEKVNGTTLVTAAHPGWTATELQRHSGTTSFFNRFFAQDGLMGALPTLYAAVAEGVKSGDYFGPDGFMEVKGHPKKVEMNALAKDDAIAEKLWEVSVELTGVKY